MGVLLLLTLVLLVLLLKSSVDGLGDGIFLGDDENFNLRGSVTMILRREIGENRLVDGLLERDDCCKDGDDLFLVLVFVILSVFSVFVILSVILATSKSSSDE